MKASLVRLRNILGIEALEFRLRDRGVTVIAGANGQGKTSVLSALAGVVKGGHDATLLRRGAEEGEIVLELDDGTVLTERVNADASKLTAKTPKGKLTAVKRWLDTVVQRETFDLVAFLRAPAGERIKLLLRALPLELPAAVKETAAKVEIALAEDCHPLEVIGKLEKAIYDQRTGINRSAKDKRSTAGELRQAVVVGADDPLVLDADAKTLGGEITRADIAQRDSIDAANAEAEEKKAAILARAKGIEGEIDAELDRRLEQANKALSSRLEEIDAQIVELRLQRSTVLANQEAVCEQYAKERGAEKLGLERQRLARLEVVDSARREKVEEAKAAWAERSADVRARLAVVVAKKEASSRAVATLQIVDRTEKEAIALEHQAEKLTTALDHLEQVREGLAKDLPIKGLSVVDGEIFLNSVPFGRLSGAERVGLAFDIARACMAGLPDGLRFVIVDGAECLDAEHFAALEKAAAAADVQVLCTRVDDGALRVEGAGA